MDEVTVVDALRAGGARFAYVHGSRAHGEPGPDSDTDVGAHFGGLDPTPWSVGMPDAVDLVVLDSTPLYLAGRIALHGRLLFDDDPPARVAWEADTRVQYLDELPYIEQNAREYLQAVSRAGVVDAERLSRIISRVRADIRQVRRVSSHHDLKTDETALAAVKYGFVTAIEGCTRAAAHIVSSEGLGAPASNAETIRLLAVRGIVEAQIAEPVARSVGFRNVLVHNYAEVNDDTVRASVDNLDDLQAFVEALAAWAAA